MNKTLLLIIFCFIATGCDKLCKYSVEDVASIQNMTGRPLSLSVCKGSAFGTATISVPALSSQGDTSLGLREASEVQGGPGGSCSNSNRPKTTTMAISLNASSFGQVKFCFDDANHRTVIMENYQSCPYGLSEQTAPAACN